MNSFIQSGTHPETSSFSREATINSERSGNWEQFGFSQTSVNDRRENVISKLPSMDLGEFNESEFDKNTSFKDLLLSLHATPDRDLLDPNVFEGIINKIEQDRVDGLFSNSAYKKTIMGAAIGSFISPLIATMLEVKANNSDLSNRLVEAFSSLEFSANFAMLGALLGFGHNMYHSSIEQKDRTQNAVSLLVEKIQNARNSVDQQDINTEFHQELYEITDRYMSLIQQKPNLFNRIKKSIYYTAATAGIFALGQFSIIGELGNSFMPLAIGICAVAISGTVFSARKDKISANTFLEYFNLASSHGRGFVNFFIPHRVVD